MAEGEFGFFFEGMVAEDPKIQTTRSGVEYLNVRCVANHRVKKDDQWQDEACWVTFCLWEKRAVAAEKVLRKGARIFARGDVRQREDKEGKAHYNFALDKWHLTRWADDGGQRRSRNDDGGEDRGGYSRRQDAGRSNEQRQAPPTDRTRQPPPPRQRALPPPPPDDDDPGLPTDDDVDNLPF